MSVLRVNLGILLTDESSSAYSSMNSSRGASQSRSNSGNKSTRNERAQVSYQQPKIVANADEVEQIIREMAQDIKHDNRKSETESGILMDACFN